MGPDRFTRHCCFQKLISFNRGCLRSNTSEECFFIIVGKLSWKVLSENFKSENNLIRRPLFNIEERVLYTSEITSI